MARDQKLISDIVSSSVLEFLSTYGINAEIKFPNDILVDGRKICGILIEHSVRGLYLVHSIVGIGLNINQRNFDATLPNPTSMALIMDERKDPAPVEPDLNSCLEEFMNIFIRALQQRLQLDSQI
jgi:BirA family biotin operon repressor/biotin-[acetyl-CoA-carboxylase] ligase